MSFFLDRRYTVNVGINEKGRLHITLVTLKCGCTWLAWSAWQARHHMTIDFPWIRYWFPDDVKLTCVDLHRELWRYTMSYPILWWMCQVWAKENIFILKLLEGHQSSERRSSRKLSWPIGDTPFRRVFVCICNPCFSSESFFVSKYGKRSYWIVFAAG